MNITVTKEKKEWSDWVKSIFGEFSLIDAEISQLLLNWSRGIEKTIATESIFEVEIKDQAEAANLVQQILLQMRFETFFAIVGNSIDPQVIALHIDQIQALLYRCFQMEDPISISPFSHKGNLLIDFSMNEDGRKELYLSIKGNLCNLIEVLKKLRPGGVLTVRQLNKKLL